MRILAIVPSVYDTNPSQRFRIEQWEPLLRERGVEVTFKPFESKALNAILYKQGHMARKLKLVGEALRRRAGEVRSAHGYDAVYVLREAALLGPPVFERWLARTGVPYVFDFDDAVFLQYVSPSNGYLSYLKFSGKTRSICRMAAHVMAGNQYLADYAGAVNDRVTIIPTTIDTAKYRVEPRAENDVPVVGWSGSFSTAVHLATVKGALRKLAGRERFRLRVIGAPDFTIEGVDVEAMPWRAATELEDLRPFDIGIMPLPDDQWSRGKCGLKALQYMALGVPTVCSPVGVNSEIIRDGENGLLASTDDEWVEKLSGLLRSKGERARLGRAGRETVEAQYSAAVQAPRVYDIFESVVRRAKEGGRARASAGPGSEGARDARV
ncbi:MAG TPA: glycosyltransferase family 4 protein [Pyrinomonadaceae bacterium]|jgi:glycosyltransferase involved in cell wall biosynthesis|nr:glycosyltransferase family 4 protein [Pyrinomonadaceae bacterium]